VECPFLHFSSEGENGEKGVFKQALVKALGLDRMIWVEQNLVMSQTRLQWEGEERTKGGVLVVTRRAY